MPDETWTCHLCGRTRRDQFISVHQVDVSHYFGLPAGSVIENIRHCNDSALCVEEAHDFSLLVKKES